MCQLRTLLQSAFICSSLFFASGCEETTPTQVLVVFDADPAIAMRADRLLIDVTNQEGEVSSWEIAVGEQAGSTDFPVTLPLVPRGGAASRTYSILATVTDDSGAVFSIQRVRSGYVQDELRELRLLFSDACADELCTDETSCRGGLCMDDCAVPAVRGTQALLTCGTGPDAAIDGAIDGGSDSAIDVTSDVMSDVRRVDVIMDGDAMDATDIGPDVVVPDETACDDRFVGRLFCDGFETSDGSMWNLPPFENSGTLAYVPAPAYRGARALRASKIGGTVGDSHAYVSTNVVVGVTPDLYIRFYLFVPSGQTPERINLGFMGDAIFDGVAFGIGEGGRMFVEAFPSRANDQGLTPLPRDTWVCIQAHLRVNDTTGSLSLSLDGGVEAQIDGVDTSPSAGLEYLNFGIGLAHPEQTTAFELSVDEVVIDSAPIGCD